MSRMYRQGDILIIENPRLNTSRLKRAVDNVLVYGEATGHAHRVEESPNVVVLNTSWDDNEKVIHATSSFRVTHDEHDTIEIPEGTYRVIRQREYDEREIRYVRD